MGGGRQARRAGAGSTVPPLTLYHGTGCTLWSASDAHDRGGREGGGGWGADAALLLAAEHARERVGERLADLRRIQSALNALIRACNARRQTGACPILTALNAGDTNDAAR